MHEISATDASPPLRIKRDDDVLRVTLDRPGRANALDRQTVDRLLDALDDPAYVAEIRALVITGAGDHFCGGFDLSQLDAEDDASLVLRFLRIETMLQRLYHAPYATIACARGDAVGAGADIFVACTYRVADPNARFRMPGWRFGIALGTRRLCDRVGSDRARAMLSESRTLTASEALAADFATHVAPARDWDDLIESFVAASSGVTGDALARLRALSVPDHRDADMAALVSSTLGPASLRERIAAYALAARSKR